MSNLKNYRILVTRPEPQGSELCQLITERGGQPISFPTIAFVTAHDHSAFEKALACLGDQDWLIFLSPQAVYSTVGAMRKQWPHFPPNLKFAAVGGGTVKALKQAGYEVAVYPTTHWSSEGLLDLPEFESVAGKKIAIICGEGGRRLLFDTLSARGAEVLPVIAYRRILPKGDVKHCLQLVKESQVDVMVCTSFQGVKHLKLLLGESAWPYIKILPMVVMSERIKSLAHNLGFQTIWVARNASNEAIVDAIAEKVH